MRLRICNNSKVHLVKIGLSATFSNLVFDRTRCLRSLGALGVVSLHFDLHPHDITAPKPDNPDTSPQGLVVGHPLVKVPDHSGQRLVIQRNMIGIDPEHLLPALAASFLEDVVDVGKSLIDLVLNVFVDYAGLIDPTA